MKTTIVAVIILLTAFGCNHTNSPNTNGSIGLVIETQKMEFPTQNQFSATVKFENNLGRNVEIINVGCGFPSFILEQSANGAWKTFASPLCADIDVPPTSLADQDTFIATIHMETDTIMPYGIYRFKFDIREGDITKQIPSEYLVSNSFYNVVAQPNQSLKLTEPAVSFSPRAKNF